METTYSEAAIEILAQAADNASKVIRNCVAANQIDARYLQYADDVDRALAKTDGVAL